MSQVMQSLRVVAACVLAVSSAVHAQASTVLEMSFRDVLEHAELVFEGRVAKVESHREDDGMIYTTVHFEVQELLKGAYSGADLTLRFLGGAVGAQRLEVTDMTLPQAGETGIYFVESLHSPQVNPLVGWSQGHFLIEPQAGGELVVLTANHEPVLAVDAADAAPVTADMNTFSKGVAKGVLVREALSAQAVSRPLSVDEFKHSVRALAAELP